jgi:hypothetical protein
MCGLYICAFYLSRSALLLSRQFVVAATAAFGASVFSSQYGYSKSPWWRLESRRRRNHGATRGALWSRGHDALVVTAATG